MSLTDQNIFSYYNVGLEGFKHDPLSFYFRLARYKFIWRTIQPGDRVLDLATGDGMGAYVLSSKAEYVLGLDREVSFVEYARNEFQRSNLEFRQCDALDGDLSNDWDVVCAVGLLEYLDDDQSFRLLHRVAAAMKPGGLAFVGTPNRLSQVVATDRRLSTHRRELDAQSLQTLLDAHFSRVELFGQNDEYILPSIPEMSFFLMGRCQK